MRLQHPHDHFVREFLSEPAHAREFLSAVLPAALANTLDWAQLRGDPATFIDEDLREQHSDLLFSAPSRTGEPQQVYLLFEHKSALDRRLARQLLGYLARIYAAQSELAPLIPLVFYHGDAPHPTGQRFSDDLSLSPERPGAVPALPPGLRLRAVRSRPHRTPGVAVTGAAGVPGRAGQCPQPGPQSARRSAATGGSVAPETRKHPHRPCVIGLSVSGDGFEAGTMAGLVSPAAVARSGGNHDFHCATTV